MALTLQRKGGVQRELPRLTGKGAPTAATPDPGTGRTRAAEAPEAEGSTGPGRRRETGRRGKAWDASGTGWLQPLGPAAAGTCSWPLLWAQSQRGARLCGLRLTGKETRSWPKRPLESPARSLGSSPGHLRAGARSPLGLCPLPEAPPPQPGRSALRALAPRLPAQAARLTPSIPQLLSLFPAVFPLITLAPSNTHCCFLGGQGPGFVH